MSRTPLLSMLDTAVVVIYACYTRRCTKHRDETNPPRDADVY